MAKSGRSSRAPSFSSDRQSVASSITFQMPATVRPPPAYIAASVASQTVTDHQNAQLRQEDPDHEELQNAVFSEQSLALLNAFLAPHWRRSRRSQFARGVSLAGFLPLREQGLRVRSWQGK